MAKNKPDAIGAIRGQIAALQMERNTLEHQPRSREEMRAIVTRYLDGAREQAATKLQQHLKEVAGGEHLRPLRAAVMPGAYGVSDAEVVPILALAMGDALTEAVCAHLDAVPEGVDRATRTARTAEINAELDTLEAEEERLICEAEDRGETILRRADARPEIILGEHEVPPLVHKDQQPEPRRRHYAEVQFYPRGR